MLKRVIAALAFSALFFPFVAEVLASHDFKRIMHIASEPHSHSSGHTHKGSKENHDHKSRDQHPISASLQSHFYGSPAFGSKEVGKASWVKLNWKYIYYPLRTDGPLGLGGIFQLIDSDRVDRAPLLSKRDLYLTVRRLRI